MNKVWSGNECERTHTLTTTTTGSKNSQKSQQSDKQSEQCSVPPKVHSLQILGLGLSQVQDTHSAINKIKRNSLRFDNLIENSQSHFQGSLFGCFEYVPYTALTIVCIINVSIDCKKNRVSNPTRRKNILD